MSTREVPSASLCGHSAASAGETSEAAAMATSIAVPFERERPRETFRIRRSPPIGCPSALIGQILHSCQTGDHGNADNSDAGRPPLVPWHSAQFRLQLLDMLGAQLGLKP